jgi:hypothetical protein
LSVKSHKKTKDYLVKGAKIKGFNYNLPGDLITKLQNSNDQIKNIHLNWKTVPFQKHYSLPSSKVVLAVEAVEPFQQQKQ